MQGGVLKYEVDPSLAKDHNHQSVTCMGSETDIA